MTTDQSTDKLLREYETHVLDVHYQSLPLWLHDRSTAIYALLAQHDSQAIAELFGPPPSQQSMQMTQVLKSLEEGLSQGLRWLHSGNSTLDIVPTSEARTLRQAGSFCEFASSYVDIADMHKMYGRGQLLVEIFDVSKTVRFSFISAGHSPIFGFAEATRRINRSPLAVNQALATDLFTEFRAKITKSSFHCEDGRIVLDDYEIVNDPSIMELMKYINPPEQLHIPENTDLIGFNLAEFNAFYSALRRWSYCSSVLFVMQVSAGARQSMCLPTQVVQKASFLRTMATLADLEQEKVANITARLTYDNRTKSPDVFQQPLICGDRSVAWSTRVVEQSRQVRNLLKLMARTPSTKDLTATIIGGRDRAMLNELGTEFARRGGCSYQIMTPLEAGQDRGDADLVVYNLKHGSELLIIEGKALLGVDEINEVDAATKEMQHAQMQLATAIKILNKLNLQAKRNLFKFVKWDSITNLIGVVVAQDAEPNDKYDHSLFPGISLATLKARLRDIHFSSPQKFWEVCKERRWLKPFDAYTELYKPIKIGDVTYELPALLEPTPTKENQKQGRIKRSKFRK